MLKMSYLMIKPDGLRYLNQIEQMIVDNGFEIVDRYSVIDWENTAKQIYKKCIGQRDDLFEKEFLCHIWLNKYLFGNYAIVILLKKIGFGGVFLLNEIMSLKKKIRHRFDASRNGTFTVVLDMERIGYSSDCVETGTLSINTKKKVKMLDENISQEGAFNSFFFQYVHCPDCNEEDAIEEITILRNIGVLRSANEITKTEWRYLKKYNERLGE